MPNIKEHFDYTVNEWSRPPFTEIIEALPEDIKGDIDIIFDVGANEGGFSHILKRKYKDASFYCFEPLTANFKELVKNVGDAVFVQKAIYYGVDKAKLEWRGSNYGACFLDVVDAGEPRMYKEEVEVTVLEDYTPPDLIKLDVEGAEVNIIQESRYIKRCPWLIIEWHPNIDPIKFFETHIPDHRVIINIENKQFLLCLN